MTKFEKNMIDPLIIDKDRQNSAKRYAALHRRVMFVELVAFFAYLVTWLFFDFGSRIDVLIRQISQNEWFLVISYVCIFGALYTLLSFPLTIYSGHILPHLFKQSNQTPGGWFVDWFKSLSLSLLVGGVMVELIYWVLRLSPDLWWLWAGSLVLIINVILVDLAPVMIFPLFYSFSPMGEEHQNLSLRIKSLAQRTGFAVEDVFIFDMSKKTNAANAGLIGLGKNRRIILGDTLVSEFSTDEIETIVAHELGHHVHRDMVTGMLFDGVLTFGGLYISSLLLKVGVVWFALPGISDIRTFPLFLMILGFYSVITMPLSNAYSRKREYQADRFAVALTQNPSAFISAMSRLANQNLAEIQPEPWVEYLLYSHPSIVKRIEKAEKYRDDQAVQTAE